MGISALHEMMKTRMDKMDDHMHRVTMSLEGFSASWLRRLLSRTGFANAKVVVGAMFDDEHCSVHPGSNKVEVDIFCPNPLTLLAIWAQMNTKAGQLH